MTHPTGVCSIRELNDRLNPVLSIEQFRAGAEININTFANDLSDMLFERDIYQETISEVKNSASEMQKVARSLHMTQQLHSVKCRFSFFLNGPIHPYIAERLASW